MCSSSLTWFITLPGSLLQVRLQDRAELRTLPTTATITDRRVLSGRRLHKAEIPGFHGGCGFVRKVLCSVHSAGKCSLRCIGRSQMHQTCTLLSSCITVPRYHSLICYRVSARRILRCCPAGARRACNPKPRSPPSCSQLARFKFFLAFPICHCHIVVESTSELS